MFLNVYGRRVRNDRKWGKIINTDFCTKITTFATRNSKNDVIWSLSSESADDMLDAPEETFTKGQHDLGWSVLPRSGSKDYSNFCR